MLSNPLLAGSRTSDSGVSPLDDAEAAKRALKEIIYTDFSNPVHARIVQKIFESIEKNGAVDHSALLGDLEPDCQSIMTALTLDRKEYGDKVKAEAGL